ncbi:MAG: ATP-binding cassette domain-containing protein [Candidatus Latescibacteria bacterium]|nr:ATP-binding cassette domain-containing protein [Candidatus Latescibacterota bacterium]
MDNNLLRVRNLKTVFRTIAGEAVAVDGISFDMAEGETLGLVGESGCGKSVTALSVMRLVRNPPGRIVSGTVEFGGRDLLRIPEKEIRKVRGNSISIVFQEPLSSLNPVFTCGEQIREVIAVHKKAGRRESRKKAVEMLRMVHIPDPEKSYRKYPHQMSGGMRQRVMIAMALCCQPELLIADEPSTALDVSVQAQILELLEELRSRMGMSVLLISHDLSVIAQMADRVMVMYAGRIVEGAAAGELFSNPSHPYTAALLRSMPGYAPPGEKFSVIEGTVPNPVKLPPGCKFSDRCPERMEKCLAEEPPFLDAGPGHICRCWLMEGEA